MNVMASSTKTLICHLFLLVSVIIATVLLGSTSTNAHTIEVGGSKGWTLHPTEDYQTWSARMRFSVNDTLHFRYNKSADSVLVVSKDDYDKCNTNNPITRLDGGDSSLTFDRPGPFYIITGDRADCDQGQKFHVVVLTPRNSQQQLAAPSTAGETSHQYSATTVSSFAVLSCLALAFGFIGSA